VIQIYEQSVQLTYFAFFYKFTLFTSMVTVVMTVNVLFFFTSLIYDLLK